LGNLHIEGVIETDLGNYLAYYDNILAVIREGKDLIVKPEQSRDGIRLIELCEESNKLRKAIKVGK
jgi:hypothetical protein